jgi:hypothetical protein
MVEYGPYEFAEPEIVTLTEFLRDCARHERIVHYDDAYNAVRQFGGYHGPHDQRLWYLLGLVSESEVAAGRHTLSAIVVVKSGEGANRPGTGFFELEKTLGRYQSDDDTTWLSEIDGLFRYWRQH